jgi:hypothetical protein
MLFFLIEWMTDCEWAVNRWKLNQMDNRKMNGRVIDSKVNFVISYEYIRSIGKKRRILWTRNKKKIIPIFRQLKLNLSEAWGVSFNLKKKFWYGVDWLIIAFLFALLSLKVVAIYCYQRSWYERRNWCVFENRL